MLHVLLIDPGDDGNVLPSLISELLAFCGDVGLFPVLHGVAGVVELLVVLQEDGG